jgi:hypothetical protein
MLLALTNSVLKKVMIAEGYDPSEGYAPRWSGTEEYIEDISYQIWEQGNVDIIRNVYSDDCPFYTLAGRVILYH